MPPYFRHHTLAWKPGRLLVSHLTWLPGSLKACRFHTSAACLEASLDDGLSHTSPDYLNGCLTVCSTPHAYLEAYLTAYSTYHMPA